MRRLNTSILALGTIAGLAMSPALSADLAIPKAMPVEAKAADPLIGFSFGTRYQTDYNFRGVSQSNLQGSYQTFFEAQFFNNFAYAGFATYQVRLPTKPDMEFDLVAGIRPTFDKFAFDLGILYYFYPNEQQLFNNNGSPFTTRNTDYYEAAGKMLYTATDSLTVGTNVFFSPNFLGTHANSTYASGTLAYTLPASFFPFLPEAYAGGFSLSSELGYFFLGSAKSSATGFDASIGRFASFNLPSYLYGNVGLSYTYKNIVLDVRYHNTDLTKTECAAFSGDFRQITNGGTSKWCGDAVIGSITFQTSTAAPGIYAEPGGFLNLFR
ncbi:TorF family putative porin [Methylobacterium sp. 77]|uniref:TorF family putative porin n=1 Tax=Methylobacterium sp. 77 TaxID=1101192 RepID=UPI000367B704|nr:TorF family putative porin [Methylobacterium sp. 77]